MKLYRLMGILLLLENHPVMTASEIAKHFEVSVRTIYRDIDVLSEAGYSIVTESGKGGGISLMYSKRLRLSAMDERELIKVARQFATKESDDVLSQNIALKIRSQLPGEAQVIFDQLTQATIVDPVSWYGKVSNVEEVLLVIQEAIIHSKKVLMDYTSGRGFVPDRLVKPMGIVKKNHVTYLVGYCEKRLEYRTFNLDKISKIQLTSETFEVDKTFDLKNYWSQTTTQYPSVQRSPRPVQSDVNENAHYPVRLRCTEQTTAILGGFKQLELTDEGHYTYDFISEDIALSQLFNLGDKIVVLSPQSLIDAITKKASHILEQYL